MYRMTLALLLLLAGGANAGIYPDTTFGGAGYVDVDVGGGPYDYRPELAVLPDRRIVAATLPVDLMPLSPQLKVVRLLPDGSRDASFGLNGIATVPLSAQPFNFGSVSRLRRLADGRLLILASMTRIESAPGGGAIHHSDVLLLRLNPDGSADPSFNAGQPRVLSSAVSPSARLLVQADGMLLLSFVADCCAGTSGFHALRLRSDGLPDPAFGTAGELVVAPADSLSRDVMSVPGGGFQILHVKPAASGSPPRNFWRRYRSDGSPDTAFGVGGEQEFAVTEIFATDRLQELADGSWLGFSYNCPRRLFDAEGRVLSYLPGCATFDMPYNTMPERFEAQLYGDRWLMNGEQRTHFIALPTDGTYLLATDRSGRMDREFAASPDGRWRSADEPGASYAVAADGDAHVVLARNSRTGIRVWRYRELRGGGASALPVPALTPGLSALLLAALAGMAMRALRRRRI